MLPGIRQQLGEEFHGPLVLGISPLADIGEHILQVPDQDLKRLGKTGLAFKEGRQLPVSQQVGPWSDSLKLPDPGPALVEVPVPDHVTGRQQLRRRNPAVTGEIGSPGKDNRIESLENVQVIL